VRIRLPEVEQQKPDSGPGCWPQMPITEGALPYVRPKQKELNAMVAALSR
jgi:hypothetical protein